MLANDIFKSEHDTEVFLNGFAIGSGNSISVNPNIKPLNVYKNGEYNAPIGIDGYNPILVEVTDPRAQKLDDAVEYYRINIDDYWNIRIKLASDVDNSQASAFNPLNGGYDYYVTFWNLYYCVYLNDNFMYAAGRNNWNNRLYTSYFSWESPPNVVASTEEINSFNIESGSATFRNSHQGFLTINAKGSRVITQTSYVWSGGSESSPSGSNSYTQDFSISFSEFSGESSSCNYITNGDSKFLKDAVNGLYNACRPFFP